MDSLIERSVSLMSEDVRARRDALILERNNGN